MNGTLKAVVLILTITILLGSLIWSLAIQSGNLTRCKTDGDATAEAVVQVKQSVIKINTSVALMQLDMGYMKTDIADILTLQRKAIVSPE